MDPDFDRDLDEVKKSIGGAEALSIFFPSLRKAVVVDTRTIEGEGPMVRVMPMVASPQERLRSIRRLRPGFPRLRTVTLIPWTRYVDSLVTTGVWERIEERLKSSGHEAAASACESVLQELMGLEKTELSNVVRGENFHTIWSAGG